MNQRFCISEPLCEEVFPYSFFALGFHTDDRLSFGLVHNYSPFVSPCQTNTIDIENKNEGFREATHISGLLRSYKLEILQISYLCHLLLVPQLDRPSPRFYRQYEQCELYQCSIKQLLNI